MTRAAGDTARADRLLERLEAVLRAPARRARWADRWTAWPDSPTIPSWPP